MSAKGKFLCTLAVVNAFFMGFAYGFNARPVLVVDNSLSALAPTLPLEPNPALTKKTSLPLKTAPGKADSKSPKSTGNSKSGKHKTNAVSRLKSASDAKSARKGSKQKVKATK